VKTPILVLAGIALLLGIAVVPLAAQSLLDNEYYHKAQDRLVQSQKALDDGDYDASARLAARASDNLAKSDDYAATMTQFYRANRYLSIAKDRVVYAKSIDADKNYKAAYDTAVTAVAGARTALDGKDYSKSIDLSKSAIAALANIAPVAKAPPKEPPANPAAPPALPQYYRVRLLLPRRDCFWRIAEYSFVYNNPWKWRLLYEVIKDPLENPKNPDLIEPGMRFVIPPLDNETREGDWDLQGQYPVFGEK
jgi:nucleoid-associated protein YgaU